MGLTTIFSCREASRELAEDGRGSWTARLHLLICRHCRRFKRQLELLGKAARLWADGLAEDGQAAALRERLTKGL